MNRTHSERVAALFRIDKACAIGFVILLWATILYVFSTILPMVEDTRVKIAMGIAGAALLLFNTSSIVAMIRHYAADKEDIYGIDIRHADAFTQLKKSGRLSRQLVE